MSSIFRIVLESPNFTFEAFGATAEQAEAALANTWNEHARQYSKGGRKLPLFDEPYDEDGTGPTVREYFDVEAAEIELGQGYRDNHPLGEKAGETLPARRSGRRPR